MIALYPNIIIAMAPYTHRTIRVESIIDKKKYDVYVVCYYN